MICERCGCALGEDDVIVCQPCSKALDGMFRAVGQKALDDPEVMAELLQHIEEEAEAS